MPADGRLDHAERLSDQAAARAAVQRQPEGVVLWGGSERRENEELGGKGRGRGKRKEETHLQQPGTSHES